MLRIHRHVYTLVTKYTTPRSEMQGAAIEGVADTRCVCYIACGSREESAVMTSHEDEAPVDFKPVHTASEGDREFERELLTVFLSDCTQRVKNLVAAASAGNAETMRREAHTIKGAGGNIGARRLQELAYQFEKLATPEHQAHAEQLAGELREEFARVRQCVEEYLRSYT